MGHRHFCAPAGNRKHRNMEKHEKSRAAQVVLYLENFGGPRFELVLLPQRQSIWPRVVVPCSFFKKVLLLVDLLFKQLPRNNYPRVCSLPLEGLSARATSGSKGAVQERGRGRRQVATKCSSQFCDGTALGVLFQRTGRRWAGRRGRKNQDF